ncbi:hypothetical protein HK097_006191 [Rhizophlyctis rosea]|uniref:Nephrocystin 3-like N-terminal domain-containing protein n=1 Tax=Rhizophlyctis rosea TaxID=64517 RepID=A0AAD5X6J5_9FUNG|nr:hypothetical protein HK097_006191 [Rhizophlyctis rosea]
MADDPDVGSARLDLRFKVLLREPLELVRDAQTVVLVFDALDECVGRGRPDILRIIRTEFQNLPPFVKLFVTSRPEPDIVAAFSLLPYQIIEPNSKENLNDIRVYARCRLLQTSFSNAQLKRLVDKLEQLVTRLADSSGGIFVWTKVALDMIDRENTLEGTLAILDELPIDTGDLYVRVFEAALGDNPSPILPSLMQTIVTVLQPLSPTALAELMGESLVHIEAAAATLAGVLVMDNGKLRLLHKSVADFLTDPSNSANPFYVDVNETNHRLARWCLQRLLLDGVLRPNICKLDPRFFNATQYLPSRIAKNLPEDVQYSCQFWMRHLALSKGSSDEASGVLVTLVADLYVSKLLVWLEVLAVLDALDIVTRYTSDIEVWWRAQYRVYAQTQLDVPLEGIDNGTEQVQSFTSSKQSKSFFSKWWRKQTSRSPQREALVRYHEVIHSRHREVETLMSDALRFVMAFRIPIRLNTPHLYLSALPFTPIGSALYQIYHPNSPRNRTNPIVPFTRRDIDGNQFRDIPTVSHGLNADWANNLFTLEGHSDNVTAVAISGDGKFAVTAADDSKVGVWEMASGSLVRLLEVDARLVAIGNDGALVVTVELPDVVKIWESATGIVINTMGEQSNPHPLTSIAVHDSGARVGTGSSDGKVKVWSIANGSVRRTFVCAAKVSSVAFRNQGYLIVALCDDGTAMTWDYKTGSCVNTVRLGGLMKQISAISDNGEHLVTCGPERITIHSTCGTRPTKKIETRSDTLTSVVVSRDGERIALVTLRGIVVWNCFQRKISHMLDHPDVTYMANGVAFSRDGESLISGSVNGTVKVWELTSTPILIGLPLDRSIAMPWAFSREGRTICMVVGERDSLDLRRFFEIRDMEEGSHLMTVAADEVGLSADDRIIMQSLAVSGDGKRIVCGWERKDGQFETMWYDARSKSVWRRTADDRLIEVAMSEDGKCFITFSTGNIHVYEVADVNQDGAADVRLYCRYPADDYADVQGEFGHVFHRRWSHKVVYTEDGWVKELIRDDDTVIVGWAPPQYRRGDGAVAAHGDRVALLGQHVAFVIGWI